MPRRLTPVRVLAALLVILGCGLGLRLARWRDEQRAPLGRLPIGDEGTYDAWARALARGDAPAGVPYMAPLPAYVLAAAHRRYPPATARGLFRLLGVLLGGLSIGLAFLCGRELAGPAVGLVAALLVAWNRSLIYYEPTLLRDGPAAAFLMLAAWALLRRRRAGRRGRVGLALLAGLVLGVGALTRENLLLVGVLAAVGVGALGWRREGRRALVAAVVLGVGLLGPALPWLVDDARREGRPSPFVTWNGGCVFYLHNRLGNLSSGYVAPPFVRRWNPEGEQEGFRSEAERRAGRRLTPHEVSSYWLRAGLRDIVAAPGLYLLKLRGRLRTLLVSGTLPQARDMRLDAHDSAVLRLPAPGFGFLVAFALLGAWTGGRGARGLALLALAVVAVTLPVAFLSRYRVPIVPLVAVLAAVGLARGAWGLRTLLRLRSPRWAPDRRTLAIALSRRGEAARAALGFGVALGLGGLLHATSPGPYTDTIGRYNRALAQLRLHEPSAAVETLQACEDPSPRTGGLLGRAAVHARRWDAAEAGYRAQVAGDPTRVDGWLGLSLALLKQGRRAEARAALARARRLDPRQPAVARLARALGE